MGPFAAAALSAVGGWIQNRSAAREARQNRQFQERMSSTQAQRGAADYAAAGFNPALAYDRPASAPGGSQASVEDALGKGVSSAMAAKAQKAQLDLSQAQLEKTAAETAAVKFGTVASTWKTIAEAKAISQRTAFEALLQPHHLRSAEIAKIMAEYGVPKGRAESIYYRMMGPAAIGIDQLSGPVAGLAGGLLGGAALLKRGGVIGSSAKGLQGMFRPPAPRRTGDWERVNARRDAERAKAIAEKNRRNRPR